MRWNFLALALTLSTAAHAEGYSDPLDRVSAELLAGKAHDWRRANETVKDRFGDMVFYQRNFPLKGEMTPDDLIACIDDIALKAEPTLPVEAMVAHCGGADGQAD
jgi:hypothetical protein